MHVRNMSKGIQSLIANCIIIFLIFKKSIIIYFNQECAINGHGLIACKIEFNIEG